MNRYKIIKTLLLLTIAMSVFGFVILIMDTTPEDRQTRLNSQIREIEWEGCQYIIWEGGRKGGITHKENCKNHE